MTPHSPTFSRTLSVLAVLALALAGCKAPPRHWSIGPFAEFAPGEGLYAVRPFWSRDTATTAPGETVHDILWPVGTWHSTPSRDWWRFALLTGDDTTVALYPLAWWKHEQSADSAGGAGGAAPRPLQSFGLFPVAGHHPHILLMDDLTFALWPLYHSYTVAGYRSRAVLWPFVTWRESPREGFGVWPFYGYATHRESTHRYALWPIATWASYRPDRDTSGAGHSWMAWPLAGHVSRERETQYLALPPLFSWTHTPQTWRLRAPWPFIELERGRPRNRTSIWPFYEHVEGFSYTPAAPREENTYRFGWQLIEHSTIKTTQQGEAASSRLKQGEAASSRLQVEERRFNFFPFVTWETRSNGDAFRRIWPFWSRTVRHGETQSERVLDLNPIRHSPGIDRNWASFWTLWRREKLPDGTTCHHFLFDFLWWHSD